MGHCIGTRGKKKSNDIDPRATLDTPTRFLTRAEIRGHFEKGVAARQNPISWNVTSLAHAHAVREAMAGAFLGPVGTIYRDAHGFYSGANNLQRYSMVPQCGPDTSDWVGRIVGQRGPRFEDSLVRSTKGCVRSWGDSSVANSLTSAFSFQMGSGKTQKIGRGIPYALGKRAASGDTLGQIRRSSGGRRDSGSSHNRHATRQQIGVGVSLKTFSVL